MSAKKMTLKDGIQSVYPQTTDDMVFFEKKNNKTLRKVIDDIEENYYTKDGTENYVDKEIAEVIHKMDVQDSSFSDSLQLTDKITRLYPFTCNLNTILKRPGYDTQVVYSKILSGIQLLQIDTDSNEKFYITKLWSYGHQRSVLQIQNESHNIIFSYSAERTSSSDRPIETINLIANDNSSTLKATIDWSKINIASGEGLDETFVIDESCIHRRFNTIDDIIDDTYRADNKAANSKILGNIVRLYPFACRLNTILTRPGYDTQVVYSSKLAGILYLHIETPSKFTFFIDQLYAYHTSRHTSRLVIKDSTNKIIFIYQSEPRQSSSSESWPVETIELTSSDGSTLKAIIDWSKINKAYGEGLDETFTIDESCIHRIPFDEQLVKNVKSIIVVDANGNGDYTTIEDALANANDNSTNHVTILVKPGEYWPAPEFPGNVPYQSGNRNVSVIGLNRDRCILKGNVGYYYWQEGIDYALLRLSGNVLIKNLTFIHTCENYTSVATEKGWDLTSPHARAFCIHNDSDMRAGSIMRIENCKMYNDHFACVGYGSKANTTFIIKNCECISDVSAENNALSEFGPQYGTLYGHLSAGQTNAPNQRLEVKDCLIRNTNYEVGIRIHDGSGASDYSNISAQFLFVRNIIRTVGQVTPYSNSIPRAVYTIDNWSYGNNVDSMNYQ